MYNWYATPTLARVVADTDPDGTRYPTAFRVARAGQVPIGSDRFPVHTKRPFVVK